MTDNSDLDEEDDDAGEGEYNDEPSITSPVASAAAVHEWGRFSAFITKELNEDGTFHTKVKAKRSAFVRNLIYLDGQKFDFTGREYLEPIYDRDDREVLLKTSRQVEKCLINSSLILMKDGTEREASTLKPGDRIVGFSDGEQVRDVVVASEPNGRKPCVRIKTRLGSELVVTTNHPLYQLYNWTEAGKLKVGDRIASLRTLGFFGDKAESLAALVGLLVGDGSMISGTGRFTNSNPVIQKWFKRLYDDVATHNTDKRSGTHNYYISTESEVYDWFREHNILGKRATEKVLPEVCFSFTRESTRQLLRGLWATDGHCKNVSKSKVDLVFCSSSPVLIRQVRLLLRKFGVVTTQRTCFPKKGSPSYIIRVVTRRSLEVFYEEIGPIPGKPFKLPKTYSNSNLDTLPREIHTFIDEERKTSGSYWKRNGFQSQGVKVNKEYAPTYQKVAEIAAALESKALFGILNTDIIWDSIVSIERETHETWALQTRSETFISDWIVNHNTTFLANNLVVDSIVQPYRKALYVSPSHQQTRQFSNEKLKPAIERSPLIRKYFQDSSVSTQVFEKGFTNGSYIFLRSAFRTADRARGISAEKLCLDELQDFYIDTIPVIAECTSHFPNARKLYAGTPKSLSNPIEVYWKSTTQNEWLVPCKACKKWNFLDEKNIAATELYFNKTLPPGPICKYCGKPIHVPDGRWISMGSKLNTIQGYRIPQLMVPWICGLYGQWLKLLWKRDNYPLSQFYNEVLGISFDSASSPITVGDLVECCGEHENLDLDRLTSDQVSDLRGMLLTGGVDWGTGLDGSEKSPSGKLRSASYTVFTIGTYTTQNKYKVLAIKKYTGKEVDPDYVVNHIARIIKTLGIQLVGCDWGFGWGPNNTLVRLVGHRHIVQLQYLSKLKQKMKYDPLGVKYLLQRNFLMSEYFFDIKHRFVQFPKWTHFEPYAKDYLAIYEEHNEFRREIKFDHRHTEPDDCFHSGLYAKLAADITTGKTRQYTMDIGEQHSD